MEIAGFTIAVVALLLSVATFYFQFFRKVRHLFLNFTWPPQKTGGSEFLAIITNGGDYSYVICTFGISFTISTGSGGRKYWTPELAVETELRKFQLKSGDHLTMTFRLPKEIPTNRFSEAMKRQDALGQTVCFFPIVFHIEFVDSSGTLVNKLIPAGEQEYDSAGRARGIKIKSQPIDLTDSLQH
jgi:hypothetical protein